jgi:hypothetical protein
MLHAAIIVWLLITFFVTVSIYYLSPVITLKNLAELYKRLYHREQLLFRLWIATTLLLDWISITLVVFFFHEQLIYANHVIDYLVRAVIADIEAHALHQPNSFCWDLRIIVGSIRNHTWRYVENVVIPFGCSFCSIPNRFARSPTSCARAHQIT